MPGCVDGSLRRAVIVSGDWCWWWGFLLPSHLHFVTRTSKAPASGKRGLLLPAFGGRGSSKTKTLLGAYRLRQLHFPAVAPFLPIPTRVPLFPRGRGGAPTHSPHSHSSAAGPDGFSRCHRPRWSPRCSFPCSLSSRLLRYSCLIGRDACCRCSAMEGRRRIRPRGLPITGRCANHLRVEIVHRVSRNPVPACRAGARASSTVTGGSGKGGCGEGK